MSIGARLEGLGKAWGVNFGESDDRGFYSRRTVVGDHPTIRPGHLAHDDMHACLAPRARNLRLLLLTANTMVTSLQVGQLPVQVPWFLTCSSCLLFDGE